MCKKTSDIEPVLNHFEKVIDYNGSYFGGYYIVIFQAPPKEILIRDCQLNALQDVYDSIAELKFFESVF